MGAGVTGAGVTGDMVGPGVTGDTVGPAVNEDVGTRPKSYMHGSVMTPVKLFPGRMSTKLKLPPSRVAIAHSIDCKFSISPVNELPDTNSTVRLGSRPSSVGKSPLKPLSRKVLQTGLLPTFCCNEGNHICDNSLQFLQGWEIESRRYTPGKATTTETK